MSEACSTKTIIFSTGFAAALNFFARSTSSPMSMPVITDSKTLMSSVDESFETLLGGSLRGPAVILAYDILAHMSKTTGRRPVCVFVACARGSAEVAQALNVACSLKAIFGRIIVKLTIETLC
ncbi:hypothetical protein EVAR_84544_1 [Eumeta japonica]|uniref:Uncharacterized protein n=1 Tax=Eumeta variegata TaxID=151549 RepID=A0A4C1UHT8_EUMVA|nr:hypothetical protein EVAR_84544_1 [Eumeta japonica]